MFRSRSHFDTGYIKNNISNIAVILMIILIALVLVLAALFSNPLKEASFIEEPEFSRIPIDDVTYIAHGGGGIDGYSVTNSKEAFESAYDKGFNYLEVDFCLTSDDEVVLLHDWNERIVPGYEKEDFPIPLYEFKEVELLDHFTPMALNDLIDFITVHPDVTIVTDIKENYSQILSLIVERYPAFLDQFLIQAYTEEEIDFVRELGFSRVLLSIYQLPDSVKLYPEKIVGICEGKALEAITFPIELCEREGYIEGLKEAGLPLMVHSFYSTDDIEYYIDKGISGFYFSSDTEW